MEPVTMVDIGATCMPDLQVGRVEASNCADSTHARPERSGLLVAQLMYLPMIGASSFFTRAGTASGRVRIACCKALAHSQVRGYGSAATASAMTRWAVLALATRFWMIM